MKLHGDRTCFVFPAYGTAFRNIMPRLAQWERDFHDEHQFWHGFERGNDTNTVNGAFFSCHSCISWSILFNKKMPPTEDVLPPRADLSDELCSQHFGHIATRH